MTSDIVNETPQIPGHRWIITLFRFFVLAILLTGTYIGYDAYTFLHTPTQLDEEEIVITIPQGSTFTQVAWSLKKQHIISDVFRFTLLAKYYNSIQAIQAGDFLITKDMLPKEVLIRITHGPQHLYRLAVPEGLTWWQTAKVIEEQGFATYEDLKEVIHDTTFLEKYSVPFTTAEGFLYPETYLLQKPKKLDKKQAELIIGLMLESFWKHTKPLWQELPRKRRLTAKSNKIGSVPHNATQTNSTHSGAVTPQLSATTNSQNTLLEPSEVDPDELKHLVILASLIERETSVPSERTRVSGVFTNRLNKGILLQCDPTIIYGIGESFSGGIRRSQIDDPNNLYNTYKHAGLPPGPIASPGYASLKAALYPEQHDYYYFVATGTGGHVFSRNYSEHEKAVQAYRRAIGRVK